MKIIYKISIILLLFSGLFLGCTESFLETENKNNIAVANYYTKAEDALKSVTSCYDPLKTNGMFGLQMQWIYYAYSPYVKHESVTWNGMAFNADDSHIDQNFTYLYRGIYRCNLAEEKFGEDYTQFEGLTEELFDRYRAEFYFLRGVYFYYAGLLYGTPPVFTRTLSSDLTDMKQPSNSKEGEAFQRSIIDLRKAIDLGLPLTYESADVGRATLGAANAMLGKVYLWIENYDSARYFLNEVVNSGVYSLVTPKSLDSAAYFNAYMSNFTRMPLDGYGGENNEESVFEIQNGFFNQNWNVSLPGYGADGSLISKYFGYQLGSYYNVSAREKVVDEFETPGPAGMAADPRLYASVFFPGDVTETDQSVINSRLKGKTPLWAPKKAFWEKVGIRKYYYPGWWEEDGGHSDPNNWRLIRYADVLLMLAEAEYHLSGTNSPAGLNAINQIRNRAGMPEITALTPLAIMHERMVEFMFELEPTFHTIRWATMKNSTPWVQNLLDYNPQFVPGKHEVLPFPLYEVDFQEGTLRQNNGY